MHGGVQGKDAKHLQLFMRLLATHVADAWKKLSLGANRYLKANKLDGFRNFETEEAYYKVNGHGKKAIFMFSAFVIENIGVPDALKKEFLVRGKTGFMRPEKEEIKSLSDAIV